MTSTSRVVVVSGIPDSDRTARDSRIASEIFASASESVPPWLTDTAQPSPVPARYPIRLWAECHSKLGAEVVVVFALVLIIAGQHEAVRSQFLHIHIVPQ
jgi:hypothetical protein